MTAPRSERPLTEACDCGGIGRHPFPVGGGWGLACDDCKAASEQEAATGMPGEGATPEQWRAWARDAFGLVQPAETEEKP